MDENAARQAFESALRTHVPGFNTFFLARLLEFDISYPDGGCVVEFPVRDFLFNPQGSLHGGAIAIALDVSMGHLINHAIGRGATTLEMKLQYMRPARAGRVRCTARFLRQGRTVSYLESRLTDAEGKLLAVATSTWLMPQS